MSIDYSDLPYGRRGTAEYLTSTQQLRRVKARLLSRRPNDPHHILCRLEVSENRWIELGPGQLITFEPELFA